MNMIAITHRLSFWRSVTLQSSNCILRAPLIGRPNPKTIFTTNSGNVWNFSVSRVIHWEALFIHRPIPGLQPAPSQFSARHVIAPPISKRNKCRVLCRWPTGLSLYTCATSNGTFRHFFIDIPLSVYLFRFIFSIHGNSTKIVSAYHTEGVYLCIYICVKKCMHSISYSYASTQQEHRKAHV